MTHIICGILDQSFDYKEQQIYQIFLLSITVDHNNTQQFQYYGWGTRPQDRWEPSDDELITVCWCGNAAPFAPRPMDDCENSKKDSSRIYFQPNSSKLTM